MSVPRRAFPALCRTAPTATPGFVAHALLSALPCAAQGFVLHRFAGTSPGNYEQMGEAVGSAGDVDRDGCADVLVGAMHQATSGRVLLYSGRSAQLLRSWTGTQGDAHLGQALVGLGDLDGDGFSEILAGAPKEEPTAVLHQGQAHVFSAASGAELYRYDGTDPFDYMGHSLAALDDVDGDAVPDFAIGRPGADIPLYADVGEIGVYSGASGALLFRTQGTVRYAWLGLALAPTGDVDGDRVPDLIGGAPNASSVGASLPNAGRAHLISGAHGGILRTFSGIAAWDRLGFSVAGVGDVDLDGVPDILVGAPQFDTSGGARGAGYAKLYSGATGNEIATLASTAFGERFGHAVAKAQDLDGDGCAEMLVSAPFATNANGAAAGEVRLYSGRTRALLATFAGRGANDYFGASLASAGDVDADGLPDLVIGAPEALPMPFYGPGYAEVLSLTGLPPGTALLGTSCAGSNGISPRMLTYGGPPALGNAAFGLSVQNGLGGSIAALWLGIAADPIGVPVLGCSLHISPPIFSLGALQLAGPLGVPGAGHRFAGLPVPASGVLAGATFYLQSFVLDPAGPQALIASTSALSLAIAP